MKVNRENIKEIIEIHLDSYIGTEVGSKLLVENNEYQEMTCLLTDKIIREIRKNFHNQGE